MARKINYKTAMEVHFHPAGAKLTVYGGITALDDKTRTVLETLKQRVPGMVAMPKASWQHSFDCDRRTHCCTLVVRGNFNTITSAVWALQRAA